MRAYIAQELIQAGVKSIEIFSCVSPAIAPAMDQNLLMGVIQRLRKIKRVEFITLVPNWKGYERFLELRLRHDGYDHTMGIFFSVVEEHNLLNLGCTIEESITEYEGIVKDAIGRGIKISAYLSASFGYYNKSTNRLIRPDIYLLNEYIDRMVEMGAKRITLSDLQGVADQSETSHIYEGVLRYRKESDIRMFGYHPHHISPQSAISNSIAVINLGIRHLDASIGGTGGCITGAPGNQPIDLLVPTLHKMGYSTGIDEKRLFSISRKVEKSLYSKIQLSPL